MSVFEADTLPAIEPLPTRNHKIVKDDTLDMSIMSNITQDLKNTLQAEDLALESASEIPEVAKPTSNLNSESHVEVLPSIVNEVSDANVANGSILTPTSNGATESVPLTEEHQHVATQPIPFEESQLEATDSLAMAESPATGQHGNLDAEENPIEAFYNTSSEISAPTGDALEADKGFILTIVQNGVDSVKVVEETPVKVDKSADPILGVPAHVTTASEAIEHPPVVHSSQADAVVTKDEPSLFEDTSDAIANHLVIPAAPAAPSESVKVVEDTSTPEAKEETDDVSTTSLIVEAVEASTHADEHAEDTALATSGEAVDTVGQVIFIEPLAKEENAPIISEPATEPVTEATDGRVLDESTISPEPHVVAEVSIPAAKEIQEVPSHVARDTEPICIAPAAIPLHTVEATGPADNIQTEPEAPNATFDAPTPASDDTLIHERNVESQEVHDMDYGDPSTAAAVPTTEKGTVEDAILPAEHSPAITTPSTEITTVDEGLMATGPHKEGPTTDVSMTEMKSLDDGPAVVEPAELEPAVLPKETAENEAEEAISGSELDSSSSNLTSAEEVSVSVSEVAGAIDAGVHEEGVSVTDVNPVAGEVFQPDEEPVPSMEIAQDVMASTNSKSVDSADPIVDEVLVSVEPSEGVVPSANPHAQETSECTLVESLPIESVKVEEVKHAEGAMVDVEVQEEESIIEEAVTEHEASRTNTIPEAGDEARASKQDDHPEGRPSAVIDSGLLSEEVESFEGKTTSGVMEEQKASEAPSDDQTAATEPTVEMEHSSEAPAPAGEAVVEREVRHVTDAVTLAPDLGTVEETVTAAEPIHVSQEAPAVETVPTQIAEREVRDAVASAPDSGTVVEMVTTAEPIHVSQVAPAMETVPAPKGTEDALGIDSSLSVEEDTPVQSSSEQPEPVDVQEHVHTDAKVVDELRLHENVETPQVQETTNVENPAVDVDSDIPAESLMKGELIRLEGEQIIEPSVASVNSSEEDIVDSSVNLGAVEETAMASGPTHVPQETSFVDTTPGQEDKDVAPEFNPSLSVEKGTPAPFSSELPTLNDVQGHAHTDARAVDELSEIPEVHQGVDVETPVVDVDSDIPADRPMKEELITDGEQLVEPLVDAPASIKSVEREVQQADLSMEAALAPEASNETKAVEGITSTPEDGATEYKSTAEEAVLSMQGTPVVHEEESRPAAGAHVPEESLTEVQPVAASEDKEVFTPPVEASKELEGTQEAAVPVGQVEIVEGAIEEDSTSTVVEKDIAPAADVQQPTAEENDLEQASFAAQQTPISPVIDEEMAVSIPNAEIVPTNQEIIVDTGKNIDEPITSVLAVAPSESLVDSILVEVASSSEGDLLKTAEAEVERPKSPWTSFQVTTVGRGVSDSIEDEQSEAQESTATLNTLSDKPILDEKVDESQEVTSAIEVAHASDNTNQVHHATPQLVVDASSLDTSVEPARPWTPSYSVHLQGSPLHSPIAIEQESFIVSGESGEQGPETDIPEVVTPDPELPESKSVDEEETSMSDNLSLSEPAIVHHFDSADESAHPLPGTDIADVAVVKDVSEVEARVVGPEKEEPAETLEASAEVDAPTHTAESSDVGYELEEVSETPKFMVGEPTELSAQVEGDGAQLLSPLSESLSERFVSSPWVPSYSVSRQGSPLQPTAELPAEASLDVLDRDDISPVDESSIALAIPQASVEDSVKVPDSVLQTSDETVGIFPEPANLTENALPVFTVKDANHAELVDDLVESKSSDLTVVIDDGANRAQDAEPPHSSATDDGVEQQKSPWTPSYSVTVQGSEMIAGEQVHVKPLSSRDVEDEVTKDANIDRPNISDIYEPEKTVTLSEESSIGLTIPQEDLSERTKQSISLHAEANLGSADPAPQESTSPVENVEQTERAVKPELPRLEPVSEAARAGTENASPPTRRRLDSTASRFIPGAWFSPASKVVNEGRTSLEIAQGEFTPLKPTSTAEDVSDSPVSDHASSTDDDNESEEEEEEKEKKGWCVVM